MGDRPAEALADGLDCSYICDVALAPQYQGLGLGKEMIEKLMADSKGHAKIIFYAKFGFAKMKTAIALFSNQEKARSVGLVEYQ